MKELKPNWFTEGLVDFEYKQYMLLAYLQYVRQHFDEMKLYPPLAELVEHVRSMQAYLQEKEEFEQAIPKRIIGFRPGENKVDYAPPTADYGGVLAEINEIVAYALPRLQAHFEEGKVIYELVEKELEVSPIGLEPMYNLEGYLLIRTGSMRQTSAYRYRVSVFEYGSERLTGIHTQFLRNFSYSVGTSYTHMKMDLVKEHKDLPNPATFVAESKLQLPVQETLMPVIKRRILQRVGRAA